MIRGPSQRGAHTADGFTLIEALVGLALLSLIAALLASSVKSTRSLLAMIERASATSALRPAQSYLRAALSQTVPAPAPTAAEMRASLSGDRTAIRFRTSYAPHGLTEGLYDVEVGLEPSRGRPERFDLVVRQQLVRPRAADRQAALQSGLRSVLATNVRTLSLQYFGTALRGAEEPAWSDEWSSVERLPRLVRVEVTFAPEFAQPWRPLDFPVELAE